MKTKIFGALALAALLPLAACDGDEAATGPQGPGTLSVLLTDAPGEFLQAWVQVERIELMVDDDEFGEGEGAGNGNGENGRVILRDDLYETDLLTLANDVATLVDEEAIPAGTYSQLRFVIPAGCIIVEGENEGEARIFSSSGYGRCADEAAAAELDVVFEGRLKMPSFAQSGLKVNLPGAGLDLGENRTVLLLDFDVSESFGKEAGRSGQWVMRPVIKAVDITLSSSITVTLQEGAESGLADVGSLADFQASLATEEEPVPFTDEDEDGIWTATFFHLLPSGYEVEGDVEGEFVTVGDYEVSVGLKDDVDPVYDFVLDPESPVTLELGDGVDEVVDFTLVSASESAGSGGTGGSGD